MLLPNRGGCWSWKNLWSVSRWLLVHICSSMRLQLYNLDEQILKVPRFPAFSIISANINSCMESFSPLHYTLCACIIFIHLFTICRNAWVVNEHHVFGRVSGGSDFPAGQMAALCGQCVCVWTRGCEMRASSLVEEGLLRLWLSPRFPVQLCFSIWFELLMCSICGRGHGVKQNTCPVAETRQAGGGGDRRGDGDTTSTCFLLTCQSLLPPSDWKEYLALLRVMISLLLISDNAFQY